MLLMESPDFGAHPPGKPSFILSPLISLSLFQVFSELALDLKYVHANEAITNFLFRRKRMIFYQHITTAIALSVGFLAAAVAQTPAAEAIEINQDSVLGKWQCAAKTNALGELKTILDINVAGSKLTAVVRTAQGAVATNNVTFVNGKLTAILSSGDGTSGRVIGRLKGDKLAGEFSYGPEITGTFQCTKASGEAAEKSDSSDASQAKLPNEGMISGEWTGVMNPSNAGEISIRLQLKQDSEVVGGIISLSQDSTPIKTGSWTNNQLTFTAETPNGKVHFRGILQGEELVGSYELTGHPGGKWRAARKTPKLK